ncbi:hypothetical protein LJB99_01335 [Deltaproteobacteria bacterium OttesenSCG-928-K17]|nr:hypothetical protein [Deltaproteobacteria bacterium OttesenSCG-928-K17]
MSGDLKRNILDAIGFIAMFIILPLSWLVFDFSTALNISLVFYFTVAEIVFIIYLVTKVGNNIENWLYVIINPLVLAAFILLQ